MFVLIEKYTANPVVCVAPPMLKWPDEDRRGTGGIRMSFKILTVYPKKNATQIGFFLGTEQKMRREIRHDEEELRKFDSVASQWSHRLRAVEEILSEVGEGTEFASLDAVIGPAGVPGEVPGGVYAVDKALIDRLRIPEPFDHPTDLGASLADALARQHRTRAYVAAPLSTDEFDPVSKLSGVPELQFGRKMHALNIKEAVHRASDELGIPFESISVVVAHLGKSFSICAHRDGRVVDLANANERGPLSPGRCGGVPASELIRMAYSGMWPADELARKVGHFGGMADYIGTDDLLQLANRLVHGDALASLIYRSMTYQIAQEIASQAVVLKGRVDAIIITGGCAHDVIFVGVIEERIDWIAKVLIYPGEDELRAMAGAAMRVLDGREAPLHYEEVVKKRNGRR